MKKLKLFFIGSSMVFLLAACSNETVITTNSSDSSDSSAVQVATIDDGKEYKIVVTRVDGSTDEHPYKKGSVTMNAVTKEDGTTTPIINYTDLDGNMQSIEINEGDSYETTEQ